MSFNAEKYYSLKNSIPAEVKIIPVSKTKPVEDILQAYDLGIRDFGENYVQELLMKQEALPKDIHWHFIGHLQSNKVKFVVPFVYMIHGVDSKKLLIEINKQGEKFNRKIKCLLQIHIAKEETKFGMNELELREVISLLPELPFIEACGFMGMASFENNDEWIKNEFLYLNSLFVKEKDENRPGFKPEILSMGMSGDYPIAIECGSNMIRVGSMLFGERNYH
jgi:hypothetical protein